MSNVASIAGAIPTLVSYNGNKVPNGTVAFVDSVYAPFVFDVASVLAADGITIVQPTSGPGRWIRQQGGGSSKWQAQTTWYIDPAAGNDENVGTVGVPLKTHAELMRRVGSSATTYVPGVVDVFVLGNLPGVTSVAWNMGQSTVVRYHGTRTVRQTGNALTAVTALARPQPLEVTGLNLSGEVGKLCRITAGARSGTWWWIAKNLGADKVRCSPGVTVSDTLPLNNSPVTPTKVTPVIGDAFETYDLSTVDALSLTLNGVDTSPDDNNSQLLFEDFRFLNNTTDYLSSLGGTIVDFVRCDCTGTHQAFGTISFAGSRVVAGRVLGDQGPAQGYVLACLIAGTIRCERGSFITIDQDSLAQAVGVIISDNAEGRIGTLGVFDFAGDGVTVQYGSLVSNRNIVDGANLVYGSANTGVGINVAAGSQWLYQTKPTVTGAGGDTKIGGTLKAYAGGIPYVESVNNAMMVVDQ